MSKNMHGSNSPLIVAKDAAPTVSRKRKDPESLVDGIMASIIASHQAPAPLAQHTRPIPEKARELLNDQSAGLPVWIRPPKQGVEFYCGFSRARLYQGAADKEFRSISIRKPGQTKGTRLFHLQSILDFISKCEQDAVKEVNA